MGGYRESIAVPDTDPFEDQEHEYNLRPVSPDSESVSSSGSSVTSAVGLMVCNNMHTEVDYWENHC